MGCLRGQAKWCAEKSIERGRRCVVTHGGRGGGGEGKRHIEIETMQFEGRFTERASHYLGDQTLCPHSMELHQTWCVHEVGAFKLIYICRFLFGQGGGVVECPGGRSLCSRLSFPLHAFKHQRQRWRKSKRGRNGALGSCCCSLPCVRV